MGQTQLQVGLDMRIMFLQGSPRNKGNCPDQTSKTARILRECLRALPEGIETDVCDLSVRRDRPIIQPCKGCVSTADGFHCHWPCDCYKKGDEERPDFMHDFDIYRRIERCDGFMVLCPVHWHGVPTQVKALFDRLVCANLSLTVQQAGKFGLDKNSKATSKMEMTDKYHSLLRNHLKGKSAAFFVHGDDGADDYREFSESRNRPPLPSTFHGHDEVCQTLCNDPIQAVMPIVWQCRYSAIDVPDDCVGGLHMNVGIPYSEANREPLNVAIDKATKVMLRLVKRVGNRDVRGWVDRNCKF